MKLSDWSKAVRARDGKCVKCGKLEDLHAHHIRPKATHPELILVLDNGMTLCYTCHKREHELNRPVRIRSENPRKNTLHARISELLRRIAELSEQSKQRAAINQELKEENARIKSALCADCWLALRKPNKRC